MSKATFINTKHIATLLSLKKANVTVKKHLSFLSSVKKSLGNFSEKKSWFFLYSE